MTSLILMFSKFAVVSEVEFIMFSISDTNLLKFICRVYLFCKSIFMDLYTEWIKLFLFKNRTC